MPDELQPIDRVATAAVALTRDLYAAVLSGRKANTLRAYQTALADFARFTGATSPAQALDQLVALPHGTANAIGLAYRADLQGRGLAPASIAHRLAALRTAVRVANQLGRVHWTLDVESPRVDTYRDTRGPGRGAYLKVLATAQERATTPTGRRNLAIIRLLHDLALRRAELTALDLADFDPQGSTVSIVGKGKTQKTALTLPAPTRAALLDWIAARGRPDHAPLFFRLDRTGKTPGDDRLTTESIRRIVRQLGADAGLSRPLRPHGLRHEAITRALDITGGNVREVQKFSRHKKLETLLVYDDNRRDLAGQVAAKVADDDQ